MSVHSELEYVKLCCSRLEQETARLRSAIARMRSHDTDEFSKEIGLIRELRERIEVLEGKVKSLQKGNAG